jgi:hypothetical protein
MNAGAVFDEIARFFVEGVTPQSLALVRRNPAHAHGQTLVAIRQSHRIDAKFLHIIEVTLLRIRVYVQSDDLHHARFVARLGMTYVRAMISHDDIRAATAVMGMPAPDPRIGETTQSVAGANWTIETYVRHAVRTGQMVEVHTVIEDAPTGAALANAAPANDAPANDAPDDVEQDPFNDFFWEPDADEEEDPRFVDGSPLLDVFRSF